MSKIYLSLRNAKGQMQTVDPSNPPVDASPEILAACAAVLSATQPKRGRGRPAGYKCSADTVDRMVSNRLATLARKRSEAQV